jgi:cell division protein FtsN
MTLQRGGFALGLIVGLLVGLALAIGVALYVTKVPVPFVNKVPQRTAEQDAAETERNKHWDPNAPLATKPATPIKPPGAAASAALPPGIAPVPPATTTTAAPPKRDPAAVPSGQTPAPTTASKPTPAPTTTATAPTPKSTKPGADPFTYFVQVGAYGKPEDAEQQRARIGLMGMSAKVSEREQSGRTMYRVRLGPYDRKEDADAIAERLSGSGVEAALVRVER